jgi:anthranilate phosphoribosyltransferase
MAPEDLGFKRVAPREIHGGETVEEAATTFLKILEGEGTEAQEQVVISNAALALFSMNESSGLESCVERATRSLKSGAAGETFKNLVNQ